MDFHPLTAFQAGLPTLIVLSSKIILVLGEGNDPSILSPQLSVYPSTLSQSNFGAGGRILTDNILLGRQML